MPTLPFSPTGFGPHRGTVLQRNGRLVAEWSDILRAAVTVGRRNARAVFQHGTHSAFEANYRAYMVKANLTEDDRQRLVRTQAYRDLDPSEKGAVSYFLSMGIAKLLCEHFFGVSWLMHLDVFDGDLHPPLGRGSRPDLVGTDTRGDWVVVEVKGRSNGMPSKPIRDGKQQCRMLRRIDARLPALRLVVGLYFDGIYSHAIMHDPDEEDEKAADLEVSPGALWRAYYQNIADAVERSENRDRLEIQGRTYEIARFPELDFSLGLDRQILETTNVDGDEAFRDAISGYLPAPQSRIVEPGDDEAVGDVDDFETQRDEVEIYRSRTAMLETPREISVGYDGTLVEVGPSWQEEGLLPPATD